MHTVCLFTAPGEEAVSVGACSHGSEPARGEAVQQRASGRMGSLRMFVWLSEGSAWVDLLPGVGVGRRQSAQLSRWPAAALFSLLRCGWRAIPWGTYGMVHALYCASVEVSSAEVKEVWSSSAFSGRRDSAGLSVLLIYDIYTYWYWFNH